MFKNYIQERVNAGANSLSLTRFMKDNQDNLLATDFGRDPSADDVKRSILAYFTNAVNDSGLKANKNDHDVDWQAWVTAIKEETTIRNVEHARASLHLRLHENENTRISHRFEQHSKRKSLASPSSLAKRHKRSNIAQDSSSSSMQHHGNDRQIVSSSTSIAQQSNESLGTRVSSQTLLLEWMRKYKTLSSENEKIESLVDHFGDDGVLDLTCQKFSSWNKTLIQTSIRSLKFPYALTTPESYIISYIYHCQDLRELYDLRELLFSFHELPDGLEYLRTAVHHMLLLWKSRKMERVNQEGWWRQFVYTPLFDHAFLQMQEFDIKRSECGSTSVKAFNTLISSDIAKLPIHRTDFAIRKTETGDDVVAGEDKPSHTSSSDVKVTRSKNKKLRESSSVVTKTQLPHPSLNSYFDPLTTMWHGRTLVIEGTKEINGKYIHYPAAECTISLFPGTYPQFSKLLKTVLALKRWVERTDKMHGALVQTTLRLFIESDDVGARSPVEIGLKEDSFELDDEGMVEMASLLSQPEDEVLHEYKEALNSCMEEDLKSAANSDILKTKATLQQIAACLDT
ncbi:hypothetical protein BJV82DRAFT_673927 [Fennellomyces sp. T-0311]|nr:hypothetical protein BJV82DRAFT_673927 [Fennellomyces sp. T-0311]